MGGSGNGGCSRAAPRAVSGGLDVISGLSHNAKVSLQDYTAWDKSNEPREVQAKVIPLLDADNVMAMSVGDTVITTPTGCETLTQLGQALVVG